MTRTDFLYKLQLPLKIKREKNMFLQIDFFRSVDYKKSFQSSDRQKRLKWLMIDYNRSSVATLWYSDEQSCWLDCMHAQADPSLQWMAVDAHAIKYCFLLGIHWDYNKFFPLKVTICPLIYCLGHVFFVFFFSFMGEPMLLAPPEICIWFFIFILCPYLSNLGLKYCIFTRIFVGKLFYFIDQSFSHFYFYSYLLTTTF